MAIVKTTFDSGSSNISQVAAWLQANATIILMISHSGHNYLQRTVIRFMRHQL